MPKPVTTDNYLHAIATVLGASPERAAAYPLTAYPTPDAALSTLVADANFACPALQVNAWTSQQAPTFAYEFNDDTAPQIFTPPGRVAPVATHGSELQYLFDLPNAPFPTPLSGAQDALATSMRAAWVSFATSGNPASDAVPWPAIGGAGSAPVLSLVPARPRIESDSDSRHHCAFWAGE